MCVFDLRDSEVPPLQIYLQNIFQASLFQSGLQLQLHDSLTVELRNFKMLLHHAVYVCIHT